MKISEVVAELSKIRAEHGDLEVKYNFDYSDFEGGIIEEEEDILWFSIIADKDGKHVLIV